MHVQETVWIVFDLAATQRVDAVSFPGPFSTNPRAANWRRRIRKAAAGGGKGELLGVAQLCPYGGAGESTTAAED